MILFPSPTTVAISGTTMSGKTTWLGKLLDHAGEMFETPPRKAMYCYGIWQPLFQIMQNKYDWLSFHEGLPGKEEINSLTADGSHNLLIVDDLMHQVVQDPGMETVFTQGAHHNNLSLIYINQNMYCQGKHSRTISLNTHFLVLMKNPRDTSQMQVLGRQVFPGNSHLLLEAYRDCMNENYGYLLVDLSPHTPDRFRLRTHIFPGEDIIVYTAK